ncbi:hypothetical protein [Streptomyces sp. NPDC018045]|uniref:hypothetical protein n=1 Tax=Streptomyces sp. NPDC018045 TaxID=3365037 RepID=UPI0037A50C74
MRHRTLSIVAPFVVPLPLALAAGCAGVAGLHDDGRARNVKAPLALWADRTPAPRVRDEDPGDQRAVPGLARVPSGDMKDVDPAAVVRADFAADGDRPPTPSAVRSPVLHDLTDDGKPDLISAVDLDARSSLLRVYSVRNEVVTRVLALRAVLAGVELAAGHLAVREPTKDPRYVSVTDYVWDGSRMGLWDLTLDDYRTPQNPLPTPAPSAPPSKSPARAAAFPRTAARPWGEPVTRPEARPEARPATRPEAGPVKRPGAGPVTRPEARPAPRPEARPAPRAENPPAPESATAPTSPA